MKIIEPKSPNELIGKWIMTNGKSERYVSGLIDIATQVTVHDNDFSILGNVHTISLHLDELSSINILEDPLSESIAGINDEVVLLRNYNSFKKDSKIIIKEFIDEEKTKFITDGIIPGGFIRIKDVYKRINTDNIRVKSFLECCEEFGFAYTINLQSIIKNLLGEKLNDVSSKINHNRHYFQLNKVQLPSFLTTITPVNKDVKYDIVFKSSEEWTKFKFAYSSEQFIQISLDFKTLWKKSIIPLLSKELQELPTKKLISYIISNSGLRTKTNSLIDINMIELIRK